MSAWDRLASRMPRESDADTAAERSMGPGRTAMLWLAANMVVTTLLTGTLFVPGVPYPTALAMILLGTLVGGSVLVLVGRIGTRTGLPTMVLTRGSYYFTAERDAVGRLLNRDPRPDAVIGVYSDSGHNILAAARHHGLRVPRDLLVACISEDPVYATTTPRPSPQSASVRTRWAMKRSTC